MEKSLFSVIILSSWARVNVISNGNNEVEEAGRVRDKSLRKHLNGEKENMRKELIRSCWHAASIKNCDFFYLTMCIVCSVLTNKKIIYFCPQSWKMKFHVISEKFAQIEYQISHLDFFLFIFHRRKWLVNILKACTKE